MAETYRSMYGLDWPISMEPTFVDLTVAKKWRLFESQGVKIDTDPGDCLVRSCAKLFPSIKMSAWTETMIRDFAAEDKIIMAGCGACGKSYAMAAMSILYWLVDPLDTACIIGSSTLVDLSVRAWGPVQTLFTELKNNADGIPIPGKLMKTMYAIVNERDEALPETMSSKASIQGRALDEGRLQGTHQPWVFVGVDELALIKDMESLKTHLTNVKIGTLGFKFVAAMNPEPWEHTTSGFLVPPNGVKITPDSGSWRSASGHFVRHYDGLKSPVVLEPKLKADFPFLMSQADIDDALALCNNDKRHPRFFKMVRGFPLESGTGSPTVLDPIVATQQQCANPPSPPMSGGRQRIGLVSGIDPAWSEGGDDAIYAGCEVFQQDGRVFLDFSSRVSRIGISVDVKEPVTKQLRDGVIARINADGGPDLYYTYVDSSGNQGLADHLDLYVGYGCGHINNSTRASELPIRVRDPRPAKEHIYDRGTEGWCVLAAFCAAGQVRGLPQSAVNALTQRRFMTRGQSDDAVMPLRLEGKEDFIKRFKGSPNEADACALAALAAKERLGVVPYGGVPDPQGVVQTPNTSPQQTRGYKEELPDSGFSGEADLSGFSSEF